MSRNQSTTHNKDGITFKNERKITLSKPSYVIALSGILYFLEAVYFGISTKDQFDEVHSSAIRTILVAMGVFHLLLAKSEFIPMFRISCTTRMVLSLILIPLYLSGRILNFDLFWIEFIKRIDPSVILAFGFKELTLSLWIFYILNYQKPTFAKTAVTIDDKEEEVIEIGSAVATLQILKDLKTISKKNPQLLGFSVQAVEDKKTGLENIYRWNVKMFGFDESCPLGNDLRQLKSRGLDDSLYLEVRFSAEYPYSPPFVRVISPRLAFRTGHITIGGSVCMEILTNTGWSSKNDIESVLIQIRMGLIDGGARLQNTKSISKYSELEAWEAFYRAARTHGWRIDGINPNKFPTYQS